MPEDPKTKEKEDSQKKQETTENNNQDKDSKNQPTKGKKTNETETKPVKTKEEKQPEDKTDEKKEHKKTEEKPAENKQEKPEQPKKQTKKSEEKPKKESKSKESEPKQKQKEDDDFQYIVRLSNTDVDGAKNIVYGLTSIKGIGMHMATLITEKSGLDKNLKVGKLSESQVKKLQDAIDNVSNYAPKWMLNHRKDYDTGEDIHFIGPEIDMKLRDEINIMKKIRSYRGIRHERGLPARGQRTRANNRKGLSLGVSKKREPSQNK